MIIRDCVWDKTYVAINVRLRLSFACPTCSITLSNTDSQTSASGHLNESEICKPAHYVSAETGRGVLIVERSNADLDITPSVTGTGTLGVLKGCCA